MPMENSFDDNVGYQFRPKQTKDDTGTNDTDTTPDSDNSDHISTEGGHAEHVLVTRISNKMDTSSTDKQIFECSICPSPVEFRSAIYIASASG